MDWYRRDGPLTARMTTGEARKEEETQDRWMERDETLLVCSINTS
jgi:hypothetical protein